MRVRPSSYEVLPDAGRQAVVFSRAVHAGIAQHARDAYPEECCGILLGQRADGQSVLSRVVPAENITDGDRRRSYQIDWRTLLDTFRRARGTDEAVLGFYHSHPDGSTAPSRRDAIDAWIDHFYVLIPITTMAVYDPTCWLIPSEGGSFQSIDVEGIDAPPPALTL